MNDAWIKACSRIKEKVRTNVYNKCPISNRELVTHDLWRKVWDNIDSVWHHKPRFK